MFKDHYIKSFPELASLPPKRQKEVLERARSETFRVKGNSGKWALSMVGMMLVPIVTSLGISFLLDVEASWSPVIGMVIGFPVAFYLYNRNYVKLIAPKVKEIAQAV